MKFEEGGQWLLLLLLLLYYYYYYYYYYYQVIIIIIIIIVKRFRMQSSSWTPPSRRKYSTRNHHLCGIIESLFTSRGNASSSCCRSLSRHDFRFIFDFLQATIPQRLFVLLFGCPRFFLFLKLFVNRLRIRHTRKQRFSINLHCS